MERVDQRQTASSWSFDFYGILFLRWKVLLIRLDFIFFLFFFPSFFFYDGQSTSYTRKIVSFKRRNFFIGLQIEKAKCKLWVTLTFRKTDCVEILGIDENF